MSGLLSFCVNYARIIKVHSQINKTKGHTVNCTLNNMCINHNQWFFSDFSHKVTLSNLKTSAGHFQILDHLF